MSMWNKASALDAILSGNLLELGMAADKKRHDLHPQPVVTYSLQETLSPRAWAELCASAPRNGDIAFSSVSDLERIPLEALLQGLAACSAHSPHAVFQQLPVSARHAYAQNLAAFAKALPAFQEAGLASLHLEIDAAAPSALPAQGLDSLLRHAVQADLPVTAALVIGHGEAPGARIDALELLASLQQETGALLSLLVAIHHSTAPEARREEDATAVDYLHTLAVTRVCLDTIPHLQADWSVMGPKVLEVALRFGADDAGSVMRSQAGSPGPSHHGGESELRRIIRDAGFRPVERDLLFRQSLLH